MWLVFVLLQPAVSHSTTSGYSMPDSLSMPAIPFASTSGQTSLHSFGGLLPSHCEYNDSSSPTLSDSGISVDAASSGSSARGVASSDTAHNHHPLTNVLSLSSNGPGMLFLTHLLWCFCCCCDELVGSAYMGRQMPRRDKEFHQIHNFT